MQIRFIKAANYSTLDFIAKLKELYSQIDCLKCKDKECCKLGVTLNKEEYKKYKRELVPLSENGMILGYVFILKKKKDGRCVYQDEQGLCTIYEERPGACRSYLCK